MSTDRVVYAYGSLRLPTIVSSLDKAKQHAHADAATSGNRQPVLTIDLDHPDRSATVLGYVTPDGKYETPDDTRRR